MKAIRIALAVVALTWAVTGAANATLTTIGQATYSGSSYNLIYDKESSLIWLDYSNIANSWEEQLSWSASIGTTLTNIILDSSYSGISWNGDWRLPTTVNGPNIWSYDGSSTAGYNINSSELGHLYYTELGNKGNVDTSGNRQVWGPANFAPFTNIQQEKYWSGTDYFATSSSWTFNFGAGNQGVEPKSATTKLGLAVRSGDVVDAAPVPEPSTMLLFGAGVAGLAFWRRKKTV